MNDDGDLPFSEPPVAEKDDHSKDETQVEEPEPITDNSRDVVREPLRLPQRRLTSKQPPPSAEQKERMESKSTKGTRRSVRVVARCLFLEALSKQWNAWQSCCTMHFSQKAARSKEKQWHGLNGRERLLSLEAVSKQWNAWQENAAASLIPPTEAKVIWRTLRKQGLQDRVMQSRFVLIDKNEGKPPLVSWFMDTQIRMCWTFGETQQPLVVKPRVPCWLSARDEKS